MACDPVRGDITGSWDRPTGFRKCKGKVRPKYDRASGVKCTPKFISDKAGYVYKRLSFRKANDKCLLHLRDIISSWVITIAVINDAFQWSIGGS